VAEDFIQKGKKLSSKGGTSSSSKGGMSNKSAKTNAVVQGIRADKYAQEKLGISGPNIMNTPAGQVVTKGFTSSTVSNQMYGSEYQAARGEYLSSQGLATARTVTDATGKTYTTYDPAIKRDGKLVYTNESRGAMEAAKREPIPLSREMYESQQKTKLAFGALATLASGMTAFFSSAYLSNKATPYSKYVQNFYDTANRSKTTAVPVSSGGNGGSTTTSSNSTSVQDSTAVAQRAKKSYRGALSGETGVITANRDPFLARADKTIRGAMV